MGDPFDLPLDVRGLMIIYFNTSITYLFASVHVEEFQFLRIQSFQDILRYLENIGRYLDNL